MSALGSDFTTSTHHIECAVESETCDFVGSVEGLDRAGYVRITCPECGWEHHLDTEY